MRSNVFNKCQLLLARGQGGHPAKRCLLGAPLPEPSILLKFLQQGPMLDPTPLPLSCARLYE